MNRDMHKIFETYTTTSAKQEIVEEGILDRLKTRGAQAVGAVKGAKDQIAGSVKGAVAGMKGDTAGVQAAQQQRQQGSIQGQIAKLESYRATAQQKIKKTSDEIFADLGKLGIDLKKISPNSINVFSASLDKSFQALIDSVKAGAAQSPTTATTGQQPAQPNTPQNNTSNMANSQAAQPASP